MEELEMYFRDYHAKFTNKMYYFATRGASDTKED